MYVPPMNQLSAKMDAFNYPNSTPFIDYPHNMHKQMICIRILGMLMCNLQWKFKEIVTWSFLKLTIFAYHEQLL